MARKSATRLSDRIREIEKAHLQVTGEHEGCAHCLLLNKIEIVLANFGRFVEKMWSMTHELGYATEHRNTACLCPICNGSGMVRMRSDLSVDAGKYQLCHGCKGQGWVIVPQPPTMIFDSDKTAV